MTSAQPMPSLEFQQAPRLTSLDLAYGLPAGFDASSPSPVALRQQNPVAAMEACLLEALQRSPCIIGFSGGRDSSTLLALAVRVARREGLELPIPATLVFPGSAAADEAAWQQLVLDHLGVIEREWVTVRGDVFDAVGSVSRQALSRHGLLWPFNTHFHSPLFELASGGAVITGFGGDELGRASIACRAARLLAGRRRPQLRDSLVLGLAFSPRPLRMAVHRSRASAKLEHMPWLTAEGRSSVTRAYASDEAAIPISWRGRVTGWIRRARYFSVCQDSLQALASGYGTTVYNPFLDEGVLDALATSGGFAGYGSRAALVEMFAGDLLPPSVVTRRTKGTFDDPMLTDTAREFARNWLGGGVPLSLVDPEQLRAHWLGENINLLSLTMMQAAWLHEAGLRTVDGSP